MSTDIELYEDEDTQQATQRRIVTDADVDAVFDTYLDRKRAEDLITREYIRQTLQDGAHPTWMPQSTALNIMDQDAQWIAQVCDDREGMIVACVEAQR